VPTVSVMRGAGGTDGGTGRFILGTLMLIGGGYLFLESVRVQTHFGLGSSMMSMGGVNLTTGMILVPFMLGIGIVFYNGRNPIGWVLVAGSMVGLAWGVLSNITLRLTDMSAFSLLTILVLFVGGGGIVLSSLRDRGPPSAEGEPEA
jgi:uncharacterized protein